MKKDHECRCKVCTCQETHAAASAARECPLCGAEHFRKDRDTCWRCDTLTIERLPYIGRRSPELGGDDSMHTFYAAYPKKQNNTPHFDVSQYTLNL